MHSQSGKILYQCDPEVLAEKQCRLEGSLRVDKRLETYYKAYHDIGLIIKRPLKPISICATRLLDDRLLSA